MQYVEKDDAGNKKNKQRRINEYKAIFLTDEELVQVINDKLESIGEEELIFDYSDDSPKFKTTNLIIQPIPII